MTVDSWRVCAWMGVSWCKKEVRSSGRCGRSAQIPFTGPLIVPHLLGCQLLSASPSLDICLQLRLLPPVTGYKPGVATASDPSSKEYERPALLSQGVQFILQTPIPPMLRIRPRLDLTSHVFVQFFLLFSLSFVSFAQRLCPLYNLCIQYALLGSVSRTLNLS